MRLLQLINEAEEFIPFTTEPVTPNQYEMQRDPEYWAEKKGKVGEIVWMSPTEYVDRCIRGFKKVGEPGAVRGGRSPEKIMRYAAEMKKGDKFPMLELDYSNGFGQEGLHRAMAAETLGVSKVPVWVIRTSPQAQEKREKQRRVATDSKKGEGDWANMFYSADAAIRDSLTG